MKPQLTLGILLHFCILFLSHLTAGQIPQPPRLNKSYNEYINLLKDSLQALQTKDTINVIRYSAVLTTQLQFVSTEKAAPYLVLALRYAGVHHDKKWFAEVCNRAGMLMLQYSHDFPALKRMNRTPLQMLDSALFWHHRALKEALAIGNSFTAGWGYRGLLNTARLHFNKSVKDSVPYFYKKAIEIATHTQDHELAAYSNWHYADYLNATGELHKAIDVLKKVPARYLNQEQPDKITQEDRIADLINALKKAEASKDTASIIDHAFNLSFLFRSLFMKDNAKTYLKIAQTYAKQYGNSMLLGYVYYNSGMLMTDLKKNDSARYYFHQAIGTGMLSAPAGWAYYEFLKKAIDDPDKYTPRDSIEFYYSKAMHIGYFVNNINVTISSDLAYSKYLCSTGNWQKAGTILQLLSLRQSQMTARRKELFYVNVHDYLAGVNNLDTLIATRKLMMKEHDVLTATTHQEQLYAKDKQYEVSKTKIILDATASRLMVTNRVLIGFVVALIVFALLIVYLFLLFRKNKALSFRNEVLLKEQNHRVKNNLQMISSLINLQSQKLLSTDAKAALEESKGRINSVAILHRMLYEGEQVGEVEITAYIRSLVEEIIYCAGRKTEIKLELPEQMHLKIEKVTSLGLIINELFTNSIKHVDRSISLEIGLTLEKNDNSIRLSYVDNGHGFSKEMWISSHSFGNQLIEIQSRQLKGDFEITSNNGFGYNLKISA